jgi:CO/xanthine dehydrogenase FAD-binding subunit
MRSFEYLAPDSVDAAVQMMAEHGPDARVMAGGTDVLVAMKRREIAPKYIVYIGDLEELKTVREEAGELLVGALVTQAELAESPLLAEKATALAIAARNCAGPIVRNLATIGGNLATATPAGDLILACMALGGKVKVRGIKGERLLPLEEFLVGPQMNSLSPDELILGVVLPLPAGPSGSGFQKLGRRRAMTISTAAASASIVLSADGATFEKVAVALGSLGATVIHSESFERALTGKPATLEEIEKWRYLAGGDACPSPRARRASAWYRCEVAAVLAARAVEDALASVKGLDLSVHRAAKKKKGKGLAGAIYSLTPPGFPNPCAVNLQMREDGSAVLQIGVVEIGQGANTVMTQMAAEALSIPYENVTVHTNDTGTTPYDFGTVSSRGTFVAGNAIIRASEQVKQVLYEAAAAVLKGHADNFFLSKGFVCDKYDADKRMPIGDAARFAHFVLKKLPIGMAFFYPKSMAADENSQGEPIAAFYYHATVAEVEVDIETGVAEVTDLYAVVDCGQAINPLLVEAQVEGGAIQAVGWALREDAQPGLTCASGPSESYNPDFMPVDLESYAVATSMDIPSLHPGYVEVFEPEGPYGAKPAGEISANSGAPAVFSAIYNAVGVRLFDMPASPEKILKALQDKAQAQPATVQG